jgi:hypothetical protein
MIWMTAVCALHAFIFCSVLAFGLAFAPALLAQELCEPMMEVAHQREWYRTERAVFSLAELTIEANFFLCAFLVGDAGFTALFAWLLA